MSQVSHDDLLLFALEVLTPDEQRMLARAIAQSDELKLELAAIRDSIDDLSWVVPSAPPVTLRERVLASAAALTVPPLRFARFTRRLARLFDLAAIDALRHLNSSLSPTQWEAAGPGVWLYHLAGGPRCQAADNGLVRIEPGARFPMHRHLGREAVVVLQGASRDSNGIQLVEGDELTLPPGVAHEVLNIGTDDCYYAVSVEGVELLQY